MNKLKLLQRIEKEGILLGFCFYLPKVEVVENVNYGGFYDFVIKTDEHGTNYLYEVDEIEIQKLFNIAKKQIKRNLISNRKRFEVLKRDNFKCQYCGKTSQETVLEIDHIIPKSKGGTDKLDNLITSCRECNRGKGNKNLSN